MLTRKVLHRLSDTRNIRLIHRSLVRCEKKFENPFERTIRVLGDDLSAVKRQFIRDERDDSSYMMNRALPSHTDILIVGGGAIGSSVAYWLKEKAGAKGLSIAVIERDQTYEKSSTVLSMGGLRQQFSLPENIQMSLYGAEFIRELKKRFGSDADVFFCPNGYLMLASESGAQQMWDNHKLQRELGAVNKILGREEIKQRFPWLNVSDIELGCLGLEKEGWFDPWAMLCLLKREAIRLDTEYVSGEVVDFDFRQMSDFISSGDMDHPYEAVNEVVVKLPNGEPHSIKFAILVIAAGADSGEIGRMLRIGTGPGLLQIPLPVERRKRYVYHFQCQGEGPGINTPFTFDYSGAYFRRDGLGGSYLGGLSPNPDEEPPTDNLDVDHQYFDDRIWPIFANRVPAFNSLKVRNAWAGYYDYNAFDENGIVGPHPYYHNVYVATGFSGHGIQQAPAVGRAVAEMILDGCFDTIDLTRLGFDRLVVDKPMFESGII